MCTLFMQIVQNTYMIFFVRSYGGGEADMGRLLLLMAMSEVPTIAASMYIMKKFSSTWMLRCFAIFDFAQFALMLVLPNIRAYVLLQLIHLVSTGMYQVPIVYYANSIVEKEDQVKAQAIIGAATNGVTAILANIIGGYLFSALSVRAVILVGSVVTLVGTVIFFIVTSDGLFPGHKRREMPWA